MAGETTLDGIIDWINERKKALKKLLNWPKDFPVGKTYTDAFAIMRWPEPLHGLWLRQERWSDVMMNQVD
jgi:hypothetical protein